MDSSQPRVAVIVLNWNNAPDTLECLESVASLTYGNFETIVVDNGSNDGSPDRILKAHPDAQLLRLHSNLGYGEGNNQGIRFALSRGAEYLLLLNNDTLAAPDMLCALVGFLEGRPHAAMAGPAVFCCEPSDVLFAAGSAIDWRRGDTRHRGMFEPSPGHPALAAPQQVDFVTGCGVLVRRSFVESAGGLDSTYYLNFEDVEWAVRARRSGFEVWHVPKARLWHKVSATLGRESPMNTYYMTRNALLFFWRHGPGAMGWLAVARILGRTARTMAAWSFKSQYDSDLFRQRRLANWLALCDFARGRSGKLNHAGAF